MNLKVKRTYPYNGLTEEFGAREGDIRPRGVSCQYLIRKDLVDLFNFLCIYLQARVGNDDEE